MSLLLYRTFDAVVRKGSFQAAAEELAFTPSAISHSISRLESKLGCRLVNREKTGIALTSQGTQLLPHIRNILELENSIQLLSNRLNGLEAGYVRLGIFHSISNSWVPNIVEIFHDRYPNVYLQIAECTYAQQEQMLLAGELDIAFVNMPVSDRLESRELFKDRLLCVAPADFAPRNGTEMTHVDLGEHPFILANELYEYHLSAYFAKHNLSIRYEQTINSDYAAVAMVHSGLGISILPEAFLNGANVKVNIYPIQDGPYRTLGLATQKPEFVAPATRALQDVITEYVGGLQMAVYLSGKLQEPGGQQ